MSRGLAWSAVLALALLGCAGGTGDGFKGTRGTVSGTVLISGKPLQEGCQVLFQSEEGGYIATGTIKGDGKYTLTCNGSFQVPAVKYLVQFSPPVVVEKKSSGPTDPSAMAMKVMGAMGSGEVKEEVKAPFPTKYGSTTTSKLDYTVKSGANTADFDLSP